MLTLNEKQFYEQMLIDVHGDILIYTTLIRIYSESYKDQAHKRLNSRLHNFVYYGGRILNGKFNN